MLGCFLTFAVNGTSLALDVIRGGFRHAKREWDVRAAIQPQNNLLADRNPIDFGQVKYAADALFFYPAFGICSDRR